MRLGKIANKLAMATDPYKYLMAVLVILHWILGWFVMSVVGFFRKDFGERYYSWLNIGFGLTAVGFFTGLGNVIFSSIAGQQQMSWAIYVAYYGVFIVAVYHRFVIWRKNRAGVEWHTLCPGTSLIKLPGVSPDAVARWVEPAVLFMLAYIAGTFHDAPLKLWLNIGGFAVLVHEYVGYYMQRQRFLDMRDGMIESRNWSAVLSGRPASETCGYTIAKSNLDILNRNPEIKTSFENLDDDVRGIMDEVPA